jgi:hypothetical protein
VIGTLYVTFIPAMALFPRFFSTPVPSAGIRTKGGHGVPQCLYSLYDDYTGPESQVPYRNHKLGEAGEPLHTPGVITQPFPSNIAFGKPTEPKNGSTAHCLEFEPPHASSGHESMVQTSESRYHRSKAKLGRVPDGVAVIPESLLANGFGISTRFSETAGEIVQGTLCDTPLNPKVATAYQTRRNYDWQSARINPISHTFGDRGDLNIDHLTTVMNWDNSTSIVDTAVDRANHDAILQDPSPLDPGPSTIAHTMRADQLRDTRDPSERPPAGAVPRSGEFHIGDTFTGMGLVTTIDSDYQAKPREYTAADEIAHGIRTPPNPFPNPLRGPGRYANLGLTDEEFMKLRDKAHIVPVVVTALALEQEEAEKIFDVVAKEQRRSLISVAEFHEEFKRISYQ